MDTTEVTGAAAATLLCLTLGVAVPVAAAPYDLADTGYYVDAPVVAVSPRYRWHTVSEPVERCVEPFDGYAERRYDKVGHAFERRHVDEHPRGAGTAAGLVGGLIGGLLGHQFGDGNGRTALTIAGAALGASIARDRVRRRADESYRYRLEPHVRTSTALHCSRTERSRQVRAADGYHVSYRFQGATFDKWMHEHPGETVRVHVAVEPW